MERIAFHLEGSILVPFQIFGDACRVLRVVRYCR